MLDLESADMQCGHTGEPASLTARVAPGARIEIGWGAWPGSHLVSFHIYRAVFTYNSGVGVSVQEGTWAANQSFDI